MNDDDLPPLPPSSAFSLTRSVYTADDMRDYARAALAAAPAQPLELTDEQINKHALLAKDCPPNSAVMLVSSIRRLAAAQEKP
jgi:hypothetical protein